MEFEKLSTRELEKAVVDYLKRRDSDPADLKILELTGMNIN